MDIFAVINDNHHVSLEDTQTCIHLKHRLKFSGPIQSKLKFTQPTPWYAPRVTIAKDSATIALSLRNRDVDEFYTYSVYCPIPYIIVGIGENYYLSDDKQNIPVIRMEFAAQTPYSLLDVIKNIEIYVYSNKLKSNAKSGMEIYGPEGDTLFSSNLHYMRIAGSHHTDWTYAEVMQKPTTHDVFNAEKMGVFMIWNSGLHEYHINGNTVDAVWVTRADPNPDFGNFEQTYVVAEHKYDNDFPITMDEVYI